MAVGSSAVIATAIIGGVLLFTGGSSNTTTTQDTSLEASSGTTSNTTESSEMATTTSESSSYNDGTYSASTSYTAPQNHTNKIDVSLTIASGKVTAVTVEGTANDSKSEQYIDGFESSIESAIVGKAISGLSVSRLSGASLTSQAFNTVLDTIRSDAAA